MIRANAYIQHVESKLQAHPVAEIFPLIEGAEFEALAADIRQHGQHEPVIVHDGMILDGRNRYRACQEVGVEPILESWAGEGGSPEAFVISKNLHRRHLNESQRAMIAKKLAKLKLGDNQHAQICAPSHDEAAKLLHVSRRSVQHAAVVQEKAAPELVKAVERGDIPVSTAAQIAHLPKARQREIAAEGKKAAARAARQSRIRSQPRREERPATPKETEHERDLRFLRETWAATCESAHEAFLEEINA